MSEKSLDDAPRSEPVADNTLAQSEQPTKPLPCPFCGTLAVILHETDWCEPPEWSVHCCACSAGTSGHTDKAIAVAIWNRRAQPPQTSPPKGT